MRNRAAVLSSAAVLSVVGVLAFAAPAQAAVVDGETPITVEVVGGDLQIGVPVAGPAMDGLTTSLDAQTLTFALGAVTVDDQRGIEAADWTVTATVLEFSGPTAIDLSTGTYTSTAVTTTDGYDVTTSNLASLDDADLLVQTGTGTGINVTTWIPTIVVTLPANALGGTYASSVEHSVL
jgi:hypothetical protein